MTHTVDDLLVIMQRLRDPQTGCPWDQRQTFATIAPHTIEEAYEVADAIERGDMGELCDELGDLLFQVAFYAQMAREMQEFVFADVVNAICEKMIRRHPHVFADAEYASEDELHTAWERHKEHERGGDARDSALDGVARALPALMRADKLQRRAARVGFDWNGVSGVVRKCREEILELERALEQADAAAVREEVGDLLFACVNLSRHAGVDGEQALRAANDKFERRFRAIEHLLSERGQRVEEAGLEELDRLWDEVKRVEQSDDRAQDS